jgi:hypothetical protein
MFGRQNTYVMEIDAEVHYPLEKIRAESSAFAALPEDDQRGVLFHSLESQVLEAAQEELSARRLRTKRAFKHKGHHWATGAELKVNPLGLASARP